MPVSTMHDSTIVCVPVASGLVPSRCWFVSALTGTQWAHTWGSGTSQVTALQVTLQALLRTGGADDPGGEGGAGYGSHVRTAISYRTVHTGRCACAVPRALVV